MQPRQPPAEAPASNLGYYAPAAPALTQSYPASGAAVLPPVPMFNDVQPFDFQQTYFQHVASGMNGNTSFIQEAGSSHSNTGPQPMPGYSNGSVMPYFPWGPGVLADSNTGTRPYSPLESYGPVVPPMEAYPPMDPWTGLQDVHMPAVPGHLAPHDPWNQGSVPSQGYPMNFAFNHVDHGQANEAISSQDNTVNPLLAPMPRAPFRPGPAFIPYLNGQVSEPYIPLPGVQPRKRRRRTAQRTADEAQSTTERNAIAVETEWEQQTQGETSVAPTAASGREKEVSQEGDKDHERQGSGRDQGEQSLSLNEDSGYHEVTSEERAEPEPTGQGNLDALHNNEENEVDWSWVRREMLEESK